MRILLVGNYALDHQASMLRYAEMLARELGSRGHDVEIISPAPVFGDMVRKPVVRKWLGYIDKYLLFPGKLRAKSTGFDLVHVCDHSNSMYLPHTAGRPSSITCHDVLAIASAQGSYAQQSISATGKVQQRWILKHLAAAHHVVCVSTNTADELRRLAGGRMQYLSVIPNPLNYPYSPAGDETVSALRTRLGLAKAEEYLFHIGGNHWYKNRPAVLRIFAGLLQKLDQAQGQSLKLVMAGQSFTPEMREIVAARGLAGQVIEIVDPASEDLRALYSGARALLFPSLYEGFGWPLIEAQTCGCPVISSNRAPMTEVAADAALYFDPANEDGAAATIAAGWNRLAALREPGLRNAKRFQLDEVIPEYERFFLLVAAERETGIQEAGATPHGTEAR